MTTSPRIATRTIRLSERKIAFVGDAYTDPFVGTEVVYTTDSGEQLVGTVAAFDTTGTPRIAFADGRWARGNRAELTVAV